jgi:hypothetical protein
MRLELKQALLAGALGIAAAAISCPAIAGTELDGKTFVIDFGRKGKAADEKSDLLSFRGGRFHSSICDKWGYASASYRAAAQGETVTFSAETRSDEDGRLVWSGTVSGAAIEGTILHYPKPGFFNSNPEPKELWFKGRIRD